MDHYTAECVGIQAARRDTRFAALRECYNREWLIGRHGHCSPAAVREALVTEVAA